MAARLAQENLASKSDIANFVKKTDFHNKLKKLNKNVTSNKTKYVLVENELNNYQKSWSNINKINKRCIFIGANYFSSGIFHNYLEFLLAEKYIKYFSGTTWINSWKSNGISN